MPSAAKIGIVGTQQDVILRRVGAFIVDHIISFLAAIVIGFGFIMAFGTEWAAYLGALVGLLGYFIILEGLFSQTLGKRLFDVVVVQPDGSKITMRQSLIRNIFRFIDGILNYALGLVVMLVNPDRKRIGDYAAGTLVVRGNSSRARRHGL